MDIQKCTNQAKNRQAKKRQTKTLPLDCSSITKTKSVLGNFEKVICFFLLKKISWLSTQKIKLHTTATASYK